MLAGVLFGPPRERQDQEALGDHRGNPDPRYQPGILVARKSWDPLRLILHIRAIQRLQLPPPREEHQQGPPQPRHRTRPQLRALFERRPEHREVERNPRHANGFRLLQQLGDHQLDGPVGGLW